VPNESPDSELPRAAVRDRLREFAARWDLRPGNEQQEAQRFLLELLQCYGVDNRSTSFTFEHHYPDGTRADLFWPGFLLVEMKSASETDRLLVHRGQAMGYWQQSADPARDIPSPRWLVLCSFRRFEIWQPGEYPAGPRATVDLTQLTERLEVLDFLRDRQPDFHRNAADLASEAVAATAGIYRSAVGRGTDPLLARDFTLQATWCMFAEDLDLLPEDNFAGVVSLLRKNPQLSSFDQLGGLFEWLGRDGPRPPAGMYRGVPYANGNLFRHPARIALESNEVELLDLASRADWSLVEPSIFGGLLQSSLGIDRRRLMGAHYTPEVEIEKIVGPTIVQPWRARIEALGSAGEALDALKDLSRFRVLDPACGCGNFLYIAYRELRRLEAELLEKVGEMHRSEGRAPPEDLPRVPLSNMLGIEKDPFAAALAQVVLWIGHKQTVDALGLDESALPLPQLSGIVQGDALVADWPACDTIIGNPPFHGTKTMREHLGADYLCFLERSFGVGVKDYCVYWFRKAHTHLTPGARAGLVATNSIAEGKNREASLDFIVSAGGSILNAVRSQPWPGEANVYVSIVNWAKGPAEKPPVPVLDGIEVGGITSELRPGTERPSDVDLPANRGRQFFGVVPGAGGDGFLLTPAAARELLARPEADYSEIVKPYLIGDDITTSPDIAPRRWVIDFGERSLEEAGLWPEALSIVRRRVKPSRDAHHKARERDQWWKHSRSVRALFAAIAPLDRFIACPATSKRIFMVWCEPHWCPSNATSAFAFEDDYSLGVLQSRVHTVWATERSTKLKNDPRYTVKSFASFPWPNPPADVRDRIAARASQLVERRRELCWGQGIGLTTLYNAVAEGGHLELASLHSQLDQDVAQAYGWPASRAADTDAIARGLGELNRLVASGEIDYEPFRMGTGPTLFD
jgi:hypothetical protein